MLPLGKYINKIYLHNELLKNLVSQIFIKFSCRQFFLNSDAISNCLSLNFYINLKRLQSQSWESFF